MSHRTDKDFLCDIIEAIRRINTYTKDMNYEEFFEDTNTQDAVFRNLEIIGEATKNISEQLRNSYLHIPWKNMAGLRDRLIHHYFGVNLDIVWNIIKEELSEVNENIEDIIKNE